jgi:Protein of unknown function (DUF1778)
VHVEPIITELRVALVGHASLAAGDPAVEGAAAHLVGALEPAVRQAILAVAQQAAAEVTAQLPDRSVDVVLADGEPMLRVTEAPASSATGAAPSDEEFDARITLRLPPSLKRLIEDSASIDGDSVNAWVVDALAKRARRSSPGSKRVTEAFDL